MGKVAPLAAALGLQRLQTLGSTDRTHATRLAATLATFRRRLSNAEGRQRGTGNTVHPSTRPAGHPQERPMNALADLLPLAPLDMRHPAFRHHTHALLHEDFALTKVCVATRRTGT